MTTPLTCPKCKGMKIRIVEHIVCPETMYQNVKGELTYFTGEEGGLCYVIKWEAICLGCGRVWRIRKRLRSDRVNIPVVTGQGDREKWLNGEPVWFVKNFEKAMGWKKVEES